MEKTGIALGHNCNLLPTIVAKIMVAILILGLQSVACITLPQISQPNCPRNCGDIEIPYPFGIGDDCHYKHEKDGLFYNLTCNHTTNPPTLIYGTNIQVTNITLDGEIRVLGDIAYDCYNDTEQILYKRNTSISLRRFAISTTQNSLIGIGCDSYVWFNGLGFNSTTQFHSGCMTMCTKEQVQNMEPSCSGVGCCQASIPKKLNNITVEAKSFYNHSYVVDFNPCSIAFVVENDAKQKHPPSTQLMSKNNDYLYNLQFPMVWNWSIGIKDCKAAQKEEGEYYLCKGNSLCVDLPDQWGYRCQCKPGFWGNPYLDDCQDIDECVEKNHTCKAPAYCVNNIGSYECLCPRGYSRQNSTNNEQNCIRDSRNKTVKIIIGVGVGVIVILVVALWLNWQHGRRELSNMREMYFNQNGGHILLSKLARRDVSMGNIVKLFTFEEINKATNNYSENSIIGRGGFGVVYKGILPNNQAVAIKKSLKVDKNQVEQFINEVIALSHVIHKNVVRLLGCCLEAEVPLLVYEFITNGTLYDHLHDERKARFLTWDVRLRIAAEVAEVLAYLHTMISMPIIHRDIKSMNILLDENCIAKVSDFGASKLVPNNQDEFATMVQGTCGYLDPEYLQTGDLTEKSDVYSFGVVLAELLTREKALSYAKPEDEKCLAIYFLRKLKEDRLLEILDDSIVSVGATEQLKEVANVVRQCLKVRGEDRPTMKQVARQLDDIRGMNAHPWSSNNGEILLQEESEYLLGEIHVNKDNDYGDVATNDPLSNGQSRVVQLVPIDDGR